MVYGPTRHAWDRPALETVQCIILDLFVANATRITAENSTDSILMDNVHKTSSEMRVSSDFLRNISLHIT